jgi:NAD kinase
MSKYVPIDRKAIIAGLRETINEANECNESNYEFSHSEALSKSDVKWLLSILTSLVGTINTDNSEHHATYGMGDGRCGFYFSIEPAEYENNLDDALDQLEDEGESDDE